MELRQQASACAKGRLDRGGHLSSNIPLQPEHMDASELSHAYLEQVTYALPLGHLGVSACDPHNRGQGTTHKHTQLLSDLQAASRGRQGAASCQTQAAEPAGRCKRQAESPGRG
jgi:hypothetical protein